MCKEHNITKEEFMECVEKSCDYDVKDFKEEQIDRLYNILTHPLV